MTPLKLVLPLLLFTLLAETISAGDCLGQPCGSPCSDDQRLCDGANCISRTAFFSENPCVSNEDLGCDKCGASCSIVGSSGYCDYSKRCYRDWPPCVWDSYIDSWGHYQDNARRGMIYPEDSDVLQGMNQTELELYNEELNKWKERTVSETISDDCLGQPCGSPCNDGHTIPCHTIPCQQLSSRVCDGAHCIERSAFDTENPCVSVEAPGCDKCGASCSDYSTSGFCDLRDARCYRDYPPCMWPEWSDYLSFARGGHGLYPEETVQAMNQTELELYNEELIKWKEQDK